MSTSQMLKGVLEGCLLAIIGRGETYGYEMVEKLGGYGLTMVSEGSIYPVLLRMQKEGLVMTVMRPSPNGPKRKYYRLTDAGELELEAFKKRWNVMAGAVGNLLEGGGNDDAVEEK
ncbi:PadR family transcriptional regulator [Bhargavaea beijingensis]|uniref:PadR family transcriptional regulator n=1 Tax=Bhargavaea beijingensis TaxID=426756 RepID=A0ABX9ZF12_9BACL|nr:PadR family transcriptional regulator [Bhargavaea beijingensis]MCW1928076.1 PadR family transcriptional regulator [Bhargavaea beijingensis]RSK34300.1 PadR family transcriptional regulator [Bhargavaea beijingensis]